MFSTSSFGIFHFQRIGLKQTQLQKVGYNKLFNNNILVYDELGYQFGYNIMAYNKVCYN
jgi:hypothetical protein